MKHYVLIGLLALAFSVQAYSDTVTISVSSVGWREEGLRQMIETVIDQADYINVFLQDYEKVPAFLDHPKITVAMGQDYPEALATGAGAKYFWADRVKGYHFTVDDDILYPHGYVAYCVDKIEQYGRKAVVGFHGSIFCEKIDDYFKSRQELWFLGSLATDTPVHMLGTGVLGYHTDTISISMKDFPERNMIDLYFAIIAQKQKVPLVCLRHSSSFFKSIYHLSYHPMSIYSQATNNHARQTALAQLQQPWIIYES